MTKKDFEVIASLFSIYSKAMKTNEEMGIKVQGSQLVREMVYKMADKLKEQNPRFNTYLFAKACGVEN